LIRRVLAGLDWAAMHAPEIADVASVPGDCPFLPRDLVTRLHQARAAQNRPLACARSGDWRHPVVGLWPVALRDDLRQALTRDNVRKIEVWTARHGVARSTGPLCRSIHSSTSTRRRTWSRPNALRRSIPARERLITALPTS
jgi:molybdopterin-guanine dinucleotide biosynthesis protein A